MATNPREATALMHELVTEGRARLEREEQIKQMIEDVPEDVREFIRDELVWLARQLREKHGYDVRKARALIREMLTVSI
jgi:uncharacterized protein YpuA (DUF1002 family)